MNLQHLQYIIEIENHGSISKAAQALFVSQPYLSKILKEEEDAYGITIFARSKNGIYPTENGRLFLDMARDLLANAANFQKVFDEHREGYRLRVSSCNCSHPNDAFIRMISAMPDTPLRFTYRETNNYKVIDDVYTNKADIGIILYHTSTKKSVEELLSVRHMECCPLFESGTWLFCREGHPLLEKKESLTVEDIYRYNFAMYSPQRNTKTMAMESMYSDVSMNLLNWNRIHQIIYVQSRSVLHDVLARTDYLGIGISPILEQEKNYHIVSIPLPDSILAKNDPKNNSFLAYIYPKDKELPRAAKAYITFLEQCYGKQSDYGRI